MNTDIKTLLSKIGKAQETWKTKLIQQWPSIIGELNDKIILERIEGNTIILGVTHPAWIQEFSSLKSLIINTVNNHLEQPLIKEVRFKSVSFRTKKKELQPINTIYTRKERTLSAREQEAIGIIKDEELKKALVSFLQRCDNV